MGGAAVLLLLMLLFFFLSSRRIKALKKQLQQLEKILQQQGKDQQQAFKQLQTRMGAANEVSEFLQKSVQTQSRRQELTERGVRSLRDGCKTISARLQALERSAGELRQVDARLQDRLEQQNTTLENARENQPLADAGKLLRQGLSVDEVALKTSLPRNEVEILNKMQALNDEAAAAPAAAAPQSSAPLAAAPAAAVAAARPAAAAAAAVAPRVAAAAAARYEGVQASAATAAAAAVPPAAVPVSGPVAGIKARSAYGMPAKSQSLRRSR